MPTDDPHRCPTAILDILSEGFRAAFLRAGIGGEDAVGYLRACHAWIGVAVAPVYTLNELQPVSITLAKRQGSCSQRFACLEAFARAHAIGTRVRGLWIDGRFWAPRFRFTRHFIPARILLALPQFYVDRDWLDVEELFGTTESLVRRNPRRFANDAETLFDALPHAAVDFRGRSRGCQGGGCDLSRFALGDAGTFATRDELFARHPLLQNTLRGRAFELLHGGRRSA